MASSGKKNTTFTKLARDGLEGCRLVRDFEPPPSAGVGCYGEGAGGVAASEVLPVDAAIFPAIP
jgi:hypothetical protein